MNQTIRRILASVVAFTLAFGSVARAATTQSPLLTVSVCGGAPHVFFINGIASPGAVGAQAEAYRLQEAMKQDSVPYQDVSAIFNPSEGRLLDIGKTLLFQKVGETVAAGSVFLEQVFRHIGGLSSTLSSDDQTALDAAVGSAISTFILGFPDAEATDTLNKGSTALVNAALDGSKVILVAHSEGNMFAQELYRRAQATYPSQYNSFAPKLATQLQVVNVATPAAAPDTGLYETSTEDAIISYLYATPLVNPLVALPANANFDTGTYTKQHNDASGHGWVEVYMNDDSNGSRQNITGLISQATFNATTADSSSSTGPMDLIVQTAAGTATYTVTAPDGTQTVTPTDFTPVSIFNPSCSKLQAGPYQVTVTGASLGALPQRANTALTLFRETTANTPPLFQYSYSGQPITYSGVALNIVSSKNNATGGYDLAFYPGTAATQ